MVLLYNIDWCILLLYLIIDIIIPVCSLFGAFFATIGLLFFNNIIASIKIIFLSFSFYFCSSTDTFHFNKGVLFKSHLINNFIPCSDLSMYGLFTMTICFVCEAQIWRCFDIQGLYLIRILFQTFWWSDFTFFSSRIL